MWTGITSPCGRNHRKLRNCSVTSSPPIEEDTLPLLCVAQFRFLRAFSSFLNLSTCHFLHFFDNKSQLSEILYDFSKLGTMFIVPAVVYVLVPHRFLLPVVGRKGFRHE